MYTCKKCGAALNEGTSFCHVCGYSADGPTAVLVKKTNPLPKALYLIPLLTVALYLLVAIIYDIVFANQVLEYRSYRFYSLFCDLIKDCAILAILPVIFWDMYRRNASKGAHTLVAVLAIVFFALQCGAAGIIRSSQSGESDISEVLYMWSSFFPGSWLIADMEILTQYATSSHSVSYILSTSVEEIAYFPALSLIICGFIGAAKASRNNVKVKTVAERSQPAPQYVPANQAPVSRPEPTPMSYAPYTDPAQPAPVTPNFVQTAAQPNYAEPTVNPWNEAPSAPAQEVYPSPAAEIGQTEVLSEAQNPWEAPVSNAYSQPKAPEAPRLVNRFCSGCGAELPEGSLFCHCCGKKR